MIIKLKENINVIIVINQIKLKIFIITTIKQSRLTYITVYLKKQIFTFHKQLAFTL